MNRRTDSDLMPFPSKDGLSTTVAFPVWQQVLLWIALAPGAFLGSMIAFWLMHFGWWLGSSRFGDDSWLYYIWLEIVTNGVCGFAWVYCAAFIAPRGKIPVAITFAGIVLFLSSLPFFGAIAREEWMSLLGLMAFNVGAIGTAVVIAKEDITFNSR